jgi:5'-deoxynucleotidase YfbR-like HD superfamily hydrolase
MIQPINQPLAPASENTIELLLTELQTPEIEVARVHQTVQSVLNLDWSNSIPAELSERIRSTDHRAYAIPRFAWREMIYRDYVGIHSQRIQMMLSQTNTDTLELLLPWFRRTYILAYTLQHDVIEGISPFGDIITPIKKQLSPQSAELMNFIERILGELLISVLRLSDWWKYDQEIINDIIEKLSTESHLVSYLDKLDAFLSCFHEIIAGNEDFIEPFHDYVEMLEDFQSGKTLPSLQNIFQNQEQFASCPQLSIICDIGTAIAQWSKINEIMWQCPNEISMRNNLWNDFWFPVYNLWKGVIRDSTITHQGGIMTWDDYLCVPGREIVPSVCIA